MKTIVIVGLFGVVIVLAFAFLRSRVAEHGTLTDLPKRIAKLKQQDSDPKAFLGFCTRDEDALYVVHQNGVFYLDYELTTPAKNDYADAFRKTAADLGHSVIETSYTGEFPLLRVDVGVSETQAADLGLEFTHRMFGHDEHTIFEFLP